MTKESDKRKVNALPFDTTKKDLANQVKQHWNVTFAHQKKVSVYTKRIMAMVLAQIDPNNTDFDTCYQFKVSDLATPEQDKSSIYKKIKIAFDELTDLKWLLEDLEKEKFTYRHLINTSDERLGYEDGIITITLNPTLKPYFIALAKNYTTYTIEKYLTFRSWYSMRMFEMLSAYKDTGVWYVKTDNFRELMDCTKKYPNVNDFLKKTLAEPLQELEETEMAFTYNKIFKKRNGRGRPSLAALEFHLKKVQPKTIPAEWYEFSDEHKTVLQRLTNEFLIDEKHIVKYIYAIGLEKTNKMMYDWKLRIVNNDIKNVKKYCNKVFCETGKELLK